MGFTPNSDSDGESLHQLKAPAADTISIARMIEEYENWGVPHFQRGSVWGAANVSALLESLYYDTPCGSIILWTPEDIDRHGVPLIRGGQLTHLIIDGQQRTRSVYAAFRGLFEPTDDGEEEMESGEQRQKPIDGEEGTERYWAINLNQVREFDDLLLGPEKRLWPLFVAIPDPRTAEEKRQRRMEELRAKKKPRWSIPESPFKYNFVPLRFFSERDFISLEKEGRLFFKTTGIESESAQDVLLRVVERLEGLRENVQRMKERRLFLKVLDRDTSLDTALQVFIRINSGGRPVQEEEKGFSVLVGKCPSTTEWIPKIFGLVRGDSRSLHASDLKRDEAMERMNERQFGFKLFIRVFVLAVTYHARRAITAKGLSFAILRDRRFLPALQGDGQIYEKLWSTTADAVVAMRRLLRDSLKLDGIRFLPDTMSLLPLFLFLIRYPGLMEGTGTDQVDVRPEFQAGFARLALLLLLKDPTKQQTMKWAAMVATTHKRAAAVLEQLQAEITLDEQVLKKAFEDANSLTNRYALLLYALERSRNARDFDYRKNDLAGDEFQVAERVVSDECRPEKQHIIPYSHLIDVYDLESTSRLSSTIANNIGNITYISQAENSLEGLSDKLAELAAEDRQNLDSHFISEIALTAYNKAKALLEQENAPDPKQLKAIYEEWIEQRQTEISRGFLTWIDEFRREWVEQQAARQSEGLTEPKPPLLDRPALPDVLRTLQLPDLIEDELIKLFTIHDWTLERNDVDSDRAGALTLCLKHKRRRIVTGLEVSPHHVRVPGAGERSPQLIQLSESDTVLEELRKLGEVFEALVEEAALKKAGKTSSKIKCRSGGRKRPTITREALLAAISKSSPDACQAAEALLGVAQELGGFVSLRDASASVRVRNVVTRRPCTMFVVTREATFYIGFLSHWDENAKVGADLARAYAHELTQILGRSPLDAAIPLADVAPHVNDVLDVVKTRGALLRGAERAVMR